MRAAPAATPQLALAGPASAAVVPTAAPAPTAADAPSGATPQSAGAGAAPAGMPAPALTKQTVVPRADEKLWDVAITADGDILFSQTCRGLAVQLRQTGGEQAESLLLFGDPKEGPTLAAPDFFCEGQSGGLGVALDPSFAENRYVYFYMLGSRRNATTGRSWNTIVRLRLAQDMRSASERTDIVDDIPYKDRGTRGSEAGAHSGGRIRFGPDGYLYVATGDCHNGTLPQDLQALGGKVLRIDRDGNAAPGNGAPLGADPRIYAYGFRNVQVWPRCLACQTLCCACCHWLAFCSRPGVQGAQIATCICSS